MKAGKALSLAIGSALFALSASAQAVTVRPFDLRWMNGDARDAHFDSSLHPGSVYVLENYFASCPACNANAVNVDALAEHYADDPRVVVVDLGIDRSDRDYQSWIARHQPNHMVLNDGARTVTNQLRTSLFPTTYVLGCDMVQTFSHVGDMDMSAAIAAVDAALDACASK